MIARKILSNKIPEGFYATLGTDSNPVMKYGTIWSVSRLIRKESCETPDENWPVVPESALIPPRGRKKETILRVSRFENWQLQRMPR